MTDETTRRDFVGLSGGAGSAAVLSVSGPPSGSNGRTDARNRVETTVSTAWQRTYGRGGVTWPEDVVATPDGGSLLACSSARERAGPEEAWLVKVDAAGAREWTRSYGGDASHNAGPLVRSPAGGYAFLGLTYEVDWGDPWLVSVDEDGRKRWERTVDDRHPTDLVTTADGGYLLAGKTGFASDPASDAWLAKVGADGTVAWQSTYPDRDGSPDDPLEDGISAVAETDDGYVFVGNSERADREGWPAWLATVDASGRLTGEQFVPEADHFSDVLVTDDGDYVVAGTHRSSTSTVDYGWLAARSRDGSVSWSRTWRNRTPEYLLATDSGYLVVGDRDIPWPLGYFEGWAASVTRDGDERWSRRFSNRGGEFLHAAVEAPEASAADYAVLGTTGPAAPDDTEFHRKDAWLLGLVETGDGGSEFPDVGLLGGAAVVALSALGLGAVTAALALGTRRRGDGVDREDEGTGDSRDERTGEDEGTGESGNVDGDGDGHEDG